MDDNWILVEDALPRHPNWVIAYNRNVNQGQPIPATYYGKNWYDDLDCEWIENPPTHWQEMPAVPR
jgi:hypothetical protein